MNAIIPLHIAALRVNGNDQSTVVGNFKGRVAAFEKIPWKSGEGASTGDTVVNLLLDQTGPANPLQPGVHLHWELPDYFRKGVHSQELGGIEFPHVPNRWLVTRYLRYRLQPNGPWTEVAPMQWVVESDFVTPNLVADADGQVRPAIPVPLPTRESKPRPWQYMGRVVEAAKWNPKGNPSDYLPSYQGADQNPYYLTSIGFLGPSFASYYPDCCSVFGFWDRFADVKPVYDAIQKNNPHELRVSYAVAGWLDAEGQDPFDSVAAKIKEAFDDFVMRCVAKGVEPDRTPIDFFLDYASSRWGWEFHQKTFPYSLADNGTLKEIHLPQKSICTGSMQEIGWDMLQNPGSTSFLSAMPDPVAPGVGQDKVSLAVGNTPLEALSALAAEKGNEDPTEILLNALQLGLLENLENQPDAVALLEEGLHSAAFSRKQGGKWWMIRQRGNGRDLDKGEPVTLPVFLAKLLDAVNDAQKEYDQGRAALIRMREQLFMDWYRYIKMIAGKGDTSLVSSATLGSFLSNSQSGELAIVVNAAKQAGLLTYIQNPESRAVTDIGQPTESDSAAYRVWLAFQALKAEIAKYPQWGISASSAAPFWNPSEPTLLVEGHRIEPARRNGTKKLTTIRISPELIQQLEFSHAAKSYPVSPADLAGIPSLPVDFPLRNELTAILGEIALLIPHYAPLIAQALQKQGAPPFTDLVQGTQSVLQILGGSYPWEESQKGGIFAAIRKLDYKPVANPTIEMDQITTLFTNSSRQGYLPLSIAWNAQRGLSEFAANRRDPYLPVSLIWEVNFESMRRTNGMDYAENAIDQPFQLDQDAVDLKYSVKGGKPAFATNELVRYKMAVELSQKPAFSISTQIDVFKRNAPDTFPTGTLDALRDKFMERYIMAQAMNGFSMMQELGLPIPQIPIQNLTMREQMDLFTKRLREQAVANPKDNWYHSGFNGRAPISQGLQAQINFGPLRAGFMQVREMEVVDVFGQRIKLQTEQRNPGGFLQAKVARSMRPAAGDQVNADKVYLPPRVMTPVRNWFRWLSASYDNAPKTRLMGKQPDSSIPTTSPVCGWLVPNHLEDRLAFYDSDGSPIGSLGVENNRLQYRTRAGNLENPTDDLELDLIKDRKPIVNPHTAAFLRYLNGQTPAFFNAFSHAILESDAHIQPPNFQDEVSLAVLVGRPLAISRAMYSLETEGGLVPISQASVDKDYPWPQDINSTDPKRRDYRIRQQYSGAQLQNIKFPVRLGNTSNSADGLVAFLPESVEGSRYDLLYSAYAKQGNSTKVRVPDSNTLTATLNGEVAYMTFLHDPRAAVHLTTGILPVEELSIPSQQYSEALQNLQVTFTTWPVLQRSDALVIPLPIEKGFKWSWVSPGKPMDIHLAENASNGNATWGYSPQTAVEGWLKLSQAPVESSSEE